MKTYFENYETLYADLENLRTLLNEQTILEFKISDDEKGMPQVRLRLIDTLPEIMAGAIRFSKEKNADFLLEKIMTDFIDRSFKDEMINPSFIENHFPGYVQTKAQEQKARLTLGNLKEYDKFANMAKSVFAKHNEKITEVSHNKIFSLTRKCK